jgi:hypothetical protein
MGIKFYCPNGHKVNVKSFLAGKKGLCPKCGVRVDIPLHSVVTSPTDSASGNGPTGLVDAEDSEDEITTTAPVTGTSIGFALKKEQPSFAEPQRTQDWGKFEGLGHELPTALAAGTTGNIPDSVMPDDDFALPPGSSPRLNTAANPVWHVQFANGEQLGPVDDAVLQSWLAEGRMGPDDLVWRQGWEQWQSALTAFPQGRQSAGNQTAMEPTANRDDNPLLDALETGLPAASTGNWFQQRHRGKREIRARLSLVLLGIVILLFALFLYVFFMRDQSSQPKETSVSACPITRPGSNTDLLAI